MCQAASVRLRRGIKSLIASAFVKLGEVSGAIAQMWLLSDVTSGVCSDESSGVCYGLWLMLWLVADAAAGV